MVPAAGCNAQHWQISDVSIKPIISTLGKSDQQGNTSFVTLKGSLSVMSIFKMVQGGGVEVSADQA